MKLPETRTSSPLCVDLDGTILATDLLWESLLILLKKNPLYLLRLPFWLARGRAFLKRQIAIRVSLDPAALPYREDVLSFLRGERRAGRPLVLATGADRHLAEQVARHLGIFDRVLASDGIVNLTGLAKLRAIREHVAPDDFDYVGNGAADLPLWRAARHSIVVGPSAPLRRHAGGLSAVSEVVSARPGRVTALVKALRLYQWVKNGLLFVPLLLAHKVTDVAALLDVLAAFVAFGACASAVYVLNDLADLEADRRHPYKQSRPFAAGHLPIHVGLLLAPSCAVAGLLGSFALLSPAFTASLLGYLALAAAYSFALKRMVVLDVLVLAGLYTLRVLAGGVAAAVPVSPWLLAFSMFFFLSLALVKRYAELRVMQDRKQTDVAGRNYRVGDMDILRGIGTASGYLSVLVVALYTNSSEVTALYAHPRALWLVGVFMLYWITRIWFLAHRGNIDEDSILFTVTDPTSYVVGALIVAVILLAASP